MKKISIFLFVTFSLLYTSCVEKVNIDLSEGEPTTVVEGYVCDEVDSSFVKVSRSINFYSTQLPPPVENATVVIEENGTPITLTHQGDGMYRFPSGWKGSPATVYKLTVQVDGETFTSTSTLIEMFEVEPQLEFKFEPASGFLPAGNTVTYFFTDSRPGNNFTSFQFGVNDTLEDFTIYFNSDALARNQRRSFLLPFTRVDSGDSVLLVFKSVSEEVTTYFEALANLNNGAPGPFQTPPANPPTNISGGAVGYFQTSAVVRVKQTVP